MSGRGRWIGSASCDEPGGGSSAVRSAASADGSSPACSRACSGPRAKITIPLLAAAAIDDGILPGDSRRDRHVLACSSCWWARCRPWAPAARRYAAFRISYRVETDLRERLFAHLQRLHFAFHDHAQTGQLMARANTDIQQVNQVVVLLPLFAASLFILVAVIVVMMIESVTLALLALGALPLLNIAATRFSHRIAPVSLELQEELGDLSGVVEESVAGVRVVKGFGSERLQAAATERRGRRGARPGARSAAWLALGLPAARRLPARARARRDPLVRRPPRARR